MKHKFITVEGADGVGKSYFLAKLRDSGFKVIMDEDLEGLGADIFHALYKEDDIFYRHGNPLQEFLCFLAVEIQESNNVKALLRSSSVIKDRGVDTICLYAALQMDGDFLKNYKKLISVAKKIVRFPDVTYVLTDDFGSIVERGQNRIKRDYSEEEVLFLNRVYDGYNVLIKEFPKRIKEVSIKGKSSDEIIRVISELCDPRQQSLNMLSN